MGLALFRIQKTNYFQFTFEENMESRIEITQLES